MQDSGKALQEKFALTRELNRLRPEMEHLQSQLFSHQGLVAEKHNLQRQLDTLEVELENDRRSKQRAKAKEDAGALVDLQSRLEEVGQSLSANKKDQEKARKEFDKQLTEANDRCHQLEDRVSTLKTKLKSVQGELKETRSELDRYHSELGKARNSLPDVEERPKKKVTIQTEPEPSRKRRVQDIDSEDMSAQTPEIDETTLKRPAKKRGSEQVLMGDKSTFSITPFLNRNKSLSSGSRNVSLPASQAGSKSKRTVPKRGPEPELGRGRGRGPAAEAEAESGARPGNSELEPDEELDELPEVGVKARVEQDAEPQQIAELKSSESTQFAAEGSIPPSPPMPESRSEAPAPTKSQKPRGRPRTKGLIEASPSKKNLPAPVPWKTGTKGTDPPPEHEVGEVSSKSDDENMAPATLATNVAKVQPEPRKSQSNAPDSKAAEGDGKRKRRKLLGTTSKSIFDDDDDEAVQRPATGPLGSSRKMKTSLSGITNAFAGKTFSPLKRDRRGVHASFLA